MLAASGWAAQQAYLRYFVVEEHVDDVHVMPDGSVQMTSSSACITTDDPTMTQQGANQRWHAMKAAIAQGNYVLLDVTRTKSGDICYCYSVLIEGGESVSFGTPRPLR